LAIEDYTQAVVISWRIQNNRDITDTAGGLAQTLEQGNQLPEPRSEPVVHVALTNSKTDCRTVIVTFMVSSIARPSQQTKNHKSNRARMFFHLCVEPLVTKSG
jgi:hypothetical protein